MPIKNLKIGLLGCGHVGASLYKLLTKNESLIEQQLGFKLAITHIAVKNLSKKRGVPAKILTPNFRDIVTHPDIDLVVELMGDVPEAFEAMKMALANKKSVVTANKAVIARHGETLFQLAEKNNCEILFEASVGGGMPILRTLREGLSSNHILSLRGIINGTSNYILDKMAKFGQSFNDVLAKAQELGYAEANPKSDIEGTDAQYKLAILIMLCYGQRIHVKNIYCQGITQVSQLDFDMAKKFNYAIKLLGITKKHGHQIEARVHPVMVPLSNPLAHVNGALNAVQYVGDFVREGMIYGQGAGGDPTASAVAADLLELARNYPLLDKKMLSPIGFQLKNLKDAQIKPMQELQCRYYLRFTAQDKASVLAKISAILGENKISIYSVYQHGRESTNDVTIVVFTHTAQEKNIQSALSEINKLKVITKKTQLIRIEDDEQLL